MLAQPPFWFIALAFIAAFLGWFAWIGLRVWRAGGPAGVDGNLARAGSVAISLVLLHSIVDYPLRSIAVMTLFAVVCALMVPAAGERHGTSPS